MNFSDVDIVLIGGGADKEQFYVLLGSYYKLANETIKGLDILDIYTEQGNRRLINNVILEAGFLDRPYNLVVGFENHGGRTYIGNNRPFGKVRYGHGNCDNSGYDGVMYKNVIGTYLHGPLLPKNPELCDFILTRALERRCGNFGGLEPLDDTLEHKANEFILNRYLYSKKKN